MLQIYNSGIEFQYCKNKFLLSLLLPEIFPKSENLVSSVSKMMVQARLTVPEL